MKTIIYLKDRRKKPQVEGNKSLFKIINIVERCDLS
jgi:hypothetical protein